MSLKSQIAAVAPDETRPAGLWRWVTVRRLLVLFMLVAVGLRLVSAVYQGNNMEALPGVWDQLSYDGLAQRVAAGHGFSFAEGHWPATRAGEPTAHWSYLYTLYLAAVYGLVGWQPLVARVIQAVVAGVLQTWLTWRIGRRLFGETVGLVAAALSACYIYFFYYGGSLITESFYIVGILWTLDVTLRLGARGQGDAARGSGRRPWLWLEFGLAVAVTVLLRQVFLLIVPVLYLWIWWQRPQMEGADLARRLRWSTVKGLAVATAVVVLLIVPWTVRNYRAFHTFVPLNTNAGFAFYWGNHPIHGTSFIPLLGTSEYYELIPQELLPLSEADIDRALLKEGLQFIADDPGRFALLSISRAREYFKFWPTSESGAVSNLARVGSFGLFLPFMLYGLWLSLKPVFGRGALPQRAQIVLLYLYMLVYAGLHLASWALIRYRIPIDAVLLIFAALGIVRLAERFGFVGGQRPAAVEELAP